MEAEKSNFQMLYYDLLDRALHLSRYHGFFFSAFPTPVTTLSNSSSTTPCERRLRDTLSSYSRVAPLALLPAPLPQSAFEHCWAIQQPLQLLVARVAHSHRFLESALKRVLPVDNFIHRLWRIYEAVIKEGVHQPISIDVVRTDYMIEWNNNTKDWAPRMVEINLIASGLPTISSRISLVHRNLLEEFRIPCSIINPNKALPLKFKKNGISLPKNNLSTDDNQLLHSLAEDFISCESSAITPKEKTLLVDNSSLVSSIGSSLAHAWRLYNDSDAVLVTVVQEREFNEPDQRGIELAVTAVEPRCRTRRYTLPELARLATLDEKFVLRIEGFAVGLFYFRAGYTPRDYKQEECWTVRLMIERSRAIKCPTVALQLANTKRVQQALYETPDGQLPHAPLPTIPREARDSPLSDAALNSESHMAQIRATFVPQVTPDSSHPVVRDALEHPENYVLKPQREGGGNNFFGDALRNKLNELLVDESGEREAFVLMKRIKPYTFNALLYRVAGFLAPEEALPTPRPAVCVNELGVYGAMIVRQTGGTDDQVDGPAFEMLENTVAGYLLRTRPLGTDEGGVASGSAVIDSVTLV